MNPKRGISESQRHDERLHDLGDVNRIASVAASVDGRRMNGWVDGENEVSKAYVEGKRWGCCRVERCQMVNITAGEWQGERKQQQNNSRESQERDKLASSSQSTSHKIILKSEIFIREQLTRID